MTLQECLAVKTKLDLYYPYLQVRIITLSVEHALFSNAATTPPHVYYGDVESDILCWEELNELVDVYWVDKRLLICEDYLYAQVACAL